VAAAAAVGRVAWVSRGDVADSAIGALAATGYDGQSCDITGPEALTMAETAERLTAAPGLRITYEHRPLTRRGRCAISAAWKRWRRLARPEPARD